MAFAEKILMRDRTICPALMFAAKRKERVAGRAEMLVVSINTRNGFNQSGAPPGSRFARNFSGLLISEERISLNHKIRPNERVKIRWLVVLKT